MRVFRLALTIRLAFSYATECHLSGRTSVFRRTPGTPRPEVSDRSIAGLQPVVLHTRRLAMHDQANAKHQIQISVAQCHGFIARKPGELKPYSTGRIKELQGSITELKRPGSSRNSDVTVCPSLIILRRWLSWCTVLLQYSSREVPGTAAWLRMECAPVISCSCCCNSCIRKCSSSVSCTDVSNHLRF
jgi:hypothetical protein